MVLANHHGDGRFAIWCAAPEGMQKMLVDADPERFFVPPYVGHRGWLGMRLDRALDWDEVAGIVEDAYAEVAPPKLVVLRGRGEELVRWRDELAREYLPDTMVIALPDGMPGLPATLDKPRRAEAVNAWLCRGVMCLEPMSDLIQLKTACKEKS